MKLNIINYEIKDTYFLYKTIGQHIIKWLNYKCTIHVPLMPVTLTYHTHLHVITIL